MSARLIIDLLRSDGSVTINKRLLRHLGIFSALAYAEILSKFAYHEERKELTDDGYFYYTVEDMENNTTLSIHQQRQALNKLKDLGLIDVTRRDVPAKRYIKVILDEKTIINCLQTPQTPIKSTSSQIVKNSRSRSLEFHAVNNTNTVLGTEYNLLGTEYGTDNRFNFSSPGDNPGHNSVQVAEVQGTAEGKKGSRMEKGSVVHPTPASCKSLKEKAEEMTRELPKKYRKLTAALIRNGVDKEKAFELAQRFENERIRNVIWHAINSKKGEGVEAKAMMIIDYLENNRKIPYLSRKEKLQLERQRWCEWGEQHPEEAARLFGLDKNGDDPGEVTFIEALEGMMDVAKFVLGEE